MGGNIYKIYLMKAMYLKYNSMDQKKKVGERGGSMQSNLTV